MNSPTRNALTLVLAFAAAGLLLVPPAMAAASGAGADQKGTAPGLSFRFDDGIYAFPAPQAEPVGTTSISKLSVRLYGAYSHIGAADINTGSSGLFDVIAMYGAKPGATLQGGYSPLHGGASFGVDLVYQLSPRFGIGIGAGYMTNSRTSSTSVTIGTSSLSLRATPALSAIPIRLGVFLDLPAGRRFGLTAHAGGSFYAGLKLDARERLEFSGGEWQDLALTGRRTSLANLGFQGGLGLEYAVTRRIGLFIEAEGRFARFKNFDTVSTSSQSSTGGPSTGTGVLYIETVTTTDGSFSMFTVEETVPVDTPDTTYRQPKIDLGGFSLQAGLRFRF